MTPIHSTRRLVVAAALLAAAACASEVAAPVDSRVNGPTGPHSGARADVASSAVIGPNANANAASGSSARGNASNSMPGQATPVACAGRTRFNASGTFGPAGGILQFGQSSLIIPGGALRDTVTISATVLDDGSSTVVFQPHGLRFYKPAGLVLDGTNCAFPTTGAASVVYVDDAGQVLQTIPAYYDPHWKAVAAPIVHFSGYAIAFRAE